MKVIVAGSRTISDCAVVSKAIAASGFEITEIVSGGARGVDLLGERYAREHGIPTKVFIAKWNDYGKAAGGMRNRDMAEYAEALIAVWDGKSRGTQDMIDKAYRRDLKVYVYNTSKEK